MALTIKWSNLTWDSGYELTENELIVKITDKPLMEIIKHFFTISTEIKVEWKFIANIIKELKIHSLHFTFVLLFVNKNSK